MSDFGKPNYEEIESFLVTDVACNNSKNLKTTVSDKKSLIH